MSRVINNLALTTALLMVLAMPNQSFAGAQSCSTSLSEIRSGFWSSNIGDLTSSQSKTPYVLNWTGSSRRQYALISFNNNGTFTLNSGRISFNSIKSNGDASNPPTIIFESCSGVWNSSSFACSGAITHLGSANGGLININQTILPSSHLIIRVTNTRDVVANYQTTFSSWSSRVDIRPSQALSS